jgi:hypothetical protein
MSNTINIRNNFPAVAKRLEELADEVGNKALVRAMNTTVDQGKTQMARQISQEFRVSVGKAKERLYVSYARVKGGLRFQAELLAGRPGGLHGNDDWRGMNLINFVGALPRRSKKGKLAQLKFQIKRAGGRKVIPGAFVATNKKTGGTAVFIREGSGRYPIKTITTIDIPQMFNTRRVNEVVRAVMVKRFETNFSRELRGVLKGYVR